MATDRDRERASASEALRGGKIKREFRSPFYLCQSICRGIWRSLSRIMSENTVILFSAVDLKIPSRFQQNAQWRTQESKVVV